MKSIISGDPDVMGQLVAWMELALTILEATASHAVRWKESEYEEFRAALTAALDLLRNQPNVSSVLMLAGTLSQRIEHYQRNTQKLIDGSISELSEIVRILVFSMEKAHADSPGSAGELHQIEEIIRSARTAEELQATKAHLIHALGRLKERSHVREQATAQLLTGLQERIVVLERSLGAGAQPSSAAGASAETTHSPAIPPVPSREEVEVAVRIESTGEAERAGEPPDAASQESRFDAATGLPGPEAATEAILAVGPKGRPNCYIAAFYVKRMDAVNARFGGTLRDEALRFCAQQIAGLTGPSEVSLFRWKGMGGFLGLLIRQGSLIDVQQEISRAFSSKLTFQSKNGSVLLPLSISTHVMHAAAHNCAGLIEGIDEFFALAMMQG